MGLASQARDGLAQKIISKGDGNRQNKQTQETQVRSLSQVVPLEKKMATHSHILSYKIP